MKIAREEIRESKNINLLLSMGMSADYKVAIENGSDIIRVGSLIFGSRWLEILH